MQQSQLPVVAIVGRPNVGKSSLYNRLIRRRMAIVHAESGVTRDRVSTVTKWDDKPYILVDTGGLGIFRQERSDDIFAERIREQLNIAVESADRIVFVCDATTGVTVMDEEVAGLLRESGKPVVVAVNKADNDALEDAADDLRQLGFDTVLPISCTHNHRIGELADLVTESFAVVDSSDEANALNIAIVGRPNVGKSTLVNRFLGEDRVIVSDLAGTTRDAIDIPITYEHAGESITLNLIDTAGLKRRRNVATPVEFFSMARTEAAIKRADLVLMLLDATAGITSQDKRICNLVLSHGKPCILLANKWDLASQNTKQKALLTKLRRELPFLTYAPLMTCCARSGYNFGKIIPEVMAMHERMQQQIATPLLNRVIQDTLERTPPPSSQGLFRIYYGVYKSSTPPTFLLFVNRKRGNQASYIRHLKNVFREAFGLAGLPIEIDITEKRRTPR